jgi:hypothetical protein
MKLIGLREFPALRKAVPFSLNFLQLVFVKRRYYEQLVMPARRIRGYLQQKYMFVSKRIHLSFCLALGARPSSGCNGQPTPQASSRVRRPLIRNAVGPQFDASVNSRLSKLARKKGE